MISTFVISQELEHNVRIEETTTGRNAIIVWFGRYVLVLVDVQHFDEALVEIPQQIAITAGDLYGLAVRIKAESSIRDSVIVGACLGNVSE